MTAIKLFALFVIFLFTLTAEGYMQPDDDRQCLGHFTIRIPQEIRGDIQQVRASYDLSEISYLGHLDKAGFNDLVMRRSTELGANGTIGAGAREDLPTGTIFSVNQTANGGTIYGTFFSGDTAFGTETRYSHRMYTQFRDVVVDLGSRIRSSNGALPARAVFCFGEGHILGPVTAPLRAQVFHALLDAKDGTRLEIISEWLAKPEIGISFDGDDAAAREVGGTKGLEIRLPPGEAIRDDGFVIVPKAAGQTFLYEGISGSSPGLRLRLRLTENSASGVKARREGATADLWEALLSGISPLPDVAARQ